VVRKDGKRWEDSNNIINIINIQNKMRKAQHYSPSSTDEIEPTGERGSGERTRARLRGGLSDCSKRRLTPLEKSPAVYPLDEPATSRRGQEGVSILAVPTGTSSSSLSPSETIG